MSHAYCHRLFTDLIRNLSIDETLVEMRRQDLCMHYEFQPDKAFELIDVDKDGEISADEIAAFLRQNNVDCTLADADNLVYDYDSSGDKKLSLSEFSQFALPATSPSLRYTAENRRFTLSHKAQQPLPADCVNLVIRLFEKEIALQRNRNIQRKSLASCPDY